MFRFLLVFVSTMCVWQTSAAQSIIRYEGSGNLEHRLDWARTAANTKGLASFRFGFSILRDSKSNSRIGNYSNNGGPTLGELLDSSDTTKRDEQNYKEVARQELDKLSAARDGQVVRRPIAVLLKFSTKSSELQEVYVSDYDSQIWFSDEALMWGGESSDSDVLALVTRLYQSVSSSSLKEDLVPVIGVLNASESTFEVLNNILKADALPDVRKQAVFWIGRHQSDQSYSTVLNTIKFDQDQEVREHAVFVLSRFDRDSVIDELVQLAKATTDKVVSEQARFWLARGIAGRYIDAKSESSEESKIQRQALYALYGDDEDDEAIPALAAIATSASSPLVRREAIMMLSRSDQPAALDALLAIGRE